MKKFLIFISFLGLLIIAEYFFLTEILSERRGGVLIISTLLMILCIYAFIRFYKKSVYSKEHY